MVIEPSIWLVEFVSVFKAVLEWYFMLHVHLGCKSGCSVFCECSCVQNF